MLTEIVLNNQEWYIIRDFIYKITGLYFSDDKKSYIQKRLKIAMDNLAITDFWEYLKRIETDRNALNKLLELITTNETYFFRDIPQLDMFSKDVLPELLNRKASKGDFRLKIWSAGCSTGEEPYTIAIILKERLEYFDDWDIEILGTDISERVLRLAQDAIYLPRSLKDVPEYIKLKYFEYSPVDKMYKLKDEIKKLVTFRYLNLYDESKMRLMRNYDVIFCRNVLIYFDEESRKKVVEYFYDALNPGGYIFLGHSESILRITKAFEIVYFDNNIAFRKPM
ncbi:chemotaxis protein methyltransferase CheR [Caldicellulosiruptor bescii]|uniref:protein-glutamate O-methyltransferase n=2 Tax=Caldicellulosiruptor bescii TaxID=31899 RepID=B9MPE4_CALBD|nr:protein-glutamate O-methyltransferase CheR [Caldicellulosiruptor bescii]ACM59705.1 MCP methyltransferase, CheR-type [Caldicellulosiruptor bescii DSM 6725]PBC89730.1 chemotaxis protein methyltransferase CheR [Caldicellulosiruptor bescii]PBC90053.1 chemotaxis protein methyltransferase CheR [Caldicellulosiruptor bescii]PBD04516.1 chemotaxis protein methyltransferase CheR [Caldicellulosiruptor bescii]PBD05850.1 chemotaxis protein methyltransferase CheR [Caldicellulosiruptor bescii]